MGLPSVHWQKKRYVRYLPRVDKMNQLELVELHTVHYIAQKEVRN